MVIEGTTRGMIGSRRKRNPSEASRKEERREREIDETRIAKCIEREF